MILFPHTNKIFSLTSSVKYATIIYHLLEFVCEGIFLWIFADVYNRKKYNRENYLWL